MISLTSDSGYPLAAERQMKVIIAIFHMDIKRCKRLYYDLKKSSSVDDNDKNDDIYEVRGLVSQEQIDLLRLQNEGSFLFRQALLIPGIYMSKEHLVMTRKVLKQRVFNLLRKSCVDLKNSDSESSANNLRQLLHDLEFLDYNDGDNYEDDNIIHDTYDIDISLVINNDEQYREKEYDKYPLELVGEKIDQTPLVLPTLDEFSLSPTFYLIYQVINKYCYYYCFCCFYCCCCCCCCFYCCCCFCCCCCFYCCCCCCY